MEIIKVKKLSPLDRFVYWIRERHNIYLKRRLGVPKPWTTDEILQQYFFTNPYREHDKVTLWFRKNLREPLCDDSSVVFTTVAFRWFNLPETAVKLMEVAPPLGLLVFWDKNKVLDVLGAARDRGEQIFTGAYMINSPPGEKKLEAIVKRIDNVWRDRVELYEDLKPKKDRQSTLQEAHERLTLYDGMGGFMAYEVVCDLRYTHVLRKAPDKLTWCNPGPGCIRGLYRIAGETWDSKGNNATSPPRPKDWQNRMLKLLHLVSRRLKHMPAFEMREIEHSLCEYDKYERLLWGDGRAKRTYKGA